MEFYRGAFSSRESLFHDGRGLPVSAVPSRYPGGKAGTKRLEILRDRVLGAPGNGVLVSGGGRVNLTGSEEGKFLL